jgi:hypothetical protein
MPRTVEEIINQAEVLAARFESHEPDTNDVKDATALRQVRNAFLDRAETERRLGETVETARAQGHSWASIGAMVGTSGEAVRQKYGQTAPRTQRRRRDRESGPTTGI